jgi:hypothetical protein
MGAEDHICNLSGSGIDVAKAYVDVAVLGGELAAQRFENEAEGHLKLAAALLPMGVTLVVMGATGGHEAALTCALETTGAAISGEVCPWRFPPWLYRTLVAAPRNTPTQLETTAVECCDSDAPLPQSERQLASISAPSLGSARCPQWADLRPTILATNSCANDAGSGLRRGASGRRPVRRLIDNVGRSCPQMSRPSPGR